MLPKQCLLLLSSFGAGGVSLQHLGPRYFLPVVRSSFPLSSTFVCMIDVLGKTMFPSTPLQAPPDGRAYLRQTAFLQHTHYRWILLSAKVLEYLVL